MAGHPDEEKLAGSGDPSDDPSLVAHLAGCGRCRERVETLRLVRESLSALRPAELPANRLEELTRRASAGTGAAAGAPGQRAHRHRGSRFRTLSTSPTTLPVVLVSLLCLAGAAIAAREATEPGSGGQQVSIRGAADTSRSPAPPAGARHASGWASAVRVGTYRMSGRDYRHETLPAGIAALLPGLGLPVAAVGAQAPADRDEAAEVATLTDAGCLRALMARVGARAVLVVDAARYEGQPALVVVLDDRTAAVPEIIGIVVARSCDAREQRMLDRVAMPA